MFTVIVRFESIGQYPYTFFSLQKAEAQYREAIRMGTPVWVGLYSAGEEGRMGKMVQEWRR